MSNLRGKARIPSPMSLDTVQAVGCLPPLAQSAHPCGLEQPTTLSAHTGTSFRNLKDTLPGVCPSSQTANYTSDSNWLTEHRLRDRTRLGARPFSRNNAEGVLRGEKAASSHTAGGAGAGLQTQHSDERAGPLTQCLLPHMRYHHSHCVVSRWKRDQL